MNYFEQLTKRCNQLNEKGNAYLDTLPFLPNDEVCDRIYKAAQRIFQEANEDWESIPDWVASAMDGWIPYAALPKNGSLHYSLGWAVASQDAHLRNLLERAEGRETKELNFPVLAPLP